MAKSKTDYSLFIDPYDNQGKKKSFSMKSGKKPKRQSQSIAVNKNHYDLNNSKSLSDSKVGTEFSGESNSYGNEE